MSNDLAWWSESLGRIELQIAREDAESASHPGQCDADVARLRDVPYIREQLDRLLWIACGDISEEVFMRESEEE